MKKILSIRDPKVLVRLFNERFQWYYTDDERRTLFSQALSMFADFTPIERANWLRVAMNNLSIPEAYEIVDFFRVGDLEVTDNELSIIISPPNGMSHGKTNPVPP